MKTTSESTSSKKRIDLLEEFFGNMDEIDSDVLFDEIDNLIDKLKAKNEAAKKRKLQEKQKKEAEEQEKKRIEHISSVTSMELLWIGKTYSTATNAQKELLPRAFPTV